MHPVVVLEQTRLSRALKLPSDIRLGQFVQEKDGVKETSTPTVPLAERVLNDGKFPTVIREEQLTNVNPRLKVTPVKEYSIEKFPAEVKLPQSSQ